MEVNGLGPIQRYSPIRSEPKTPPQKTEQAQPSSARDEVEISSVGKLMEKANQSPEVRAERLAQIKAAIDAGEYDTPEKMEAALEKLLGTIDLGGE